MQLYHIIFNNLRRRMAKMLFVLLGLVIGIATIVSVFGVIEAMKQKMTQQISDFGVNVVITPDAGGLTFSYGGITLPEILYDVEQLTMKDIEKVQSLPSNNMIRVIAPKLIGVDSLENGRKVIVVGSNLREEFLVKPWLRLQNAGEMPVSEEQKTLEKMQEDNKMIDFEFLDLTRQDLVLLDLSDSQVLIGSSVAAYTGIKEGDLLTLSNGQYKVFAVLSESGTAEDGQILMNLSAAQELLGRPGKISVIDMAVDYQLGSEEVLLSEINEALSHVQVSSLRQETLRRDEMLTRLVRFGMSVSVLVLLIGMLVVSLTMSSSVRERTREIGVFRAIGFRKTHIMKMIMMEGIFISAAGGIIGYPTGMLISQFIGPILTGMDIQVPWRLDILVMAITLAIVIGLLSSLHPAVQAAKKDPAEALRFI